MDIIRNAAVATIIRVTAATNTTMTMDAAAVTNTTMTTDATAAIAMTSLITSPLMTTIMTMTKAPKPC